MVKQQHVQSLPLRASIKPIYHQVFMSGGRLKVHVQCKYMLGHCVGERVYFGVGFQLLGH